MTDRHDQVVETPSVKVSVSQGADITLTAPTGDITFVPGETVRLAASVSQGGADITKVEFFKNDELIGLDIVEGLFDTARPIGCDLVHPCFLSQAEENTKIVGREIAGRALYFPQPSFIL